MGYPRYSNVQRADTSAMSLEAYLQQINRLHPNLPDVYLHYLRLLTDFHGKQFERMYKEGQLEINAEMFEKVLQSFQNMKNVNPEQFLNYVENMGFKEAIKNIFEIGGGLSFEEWLALIDISFETDLETYINYMLLISQFTTEQKQRLSQFNEVSVYTFFYDMFITNEIQHFDTYLSSLIRSLRTGTFEYMDEQGRLQVYTDYKYNEALNQLFTSIYTSLNNHIVTHPTNSTNIDLGINLYNLLLDGLSFGQSFKELFPDFFSEELIKETGGKTLQDIAIELFDINVGVEMSPFTLEFGSAELAPVMYFDFANEDGYDGVSSITTGLTGAYGYTSAITLVSDPVLDEVGRVKQIKVMANWDNLQDIPPLQVSMKAMCYNEPDLDVDV